MKPTLFSIGSLTVTSFGLFIALSFVVGIFVVWKIAKSYDLEVEKVIDLVLLTFFGGLVGARILFVVLNWPIYTSLEKILLINRYDYQSTNCSHHTFHHKYHHSNLQLHLHCNKHH